MPLQALSSWAKFNYTITFILLPWPFFIYEFFTSYKFQSLVKRS